MTADVIFLPDCAALPPLLIRELFGQNPLNWNSETGLFLSEQKIAVDFDGFRYFLPVLKNDYLSPKLFLDLHLLQIPSNSLYSRLDGPELTFSGPSASVKRNCSPFSVSPMIWANRNDLVDDREQTAEVTLKNSKQTLVFHSIPVITASHDRMSVILPQKWNSIIGMPEDISVDFTPIVTDDSVLAFDRIITENDVRVAKRKNQTIRLDKNTRLTPAAKELGKDLNIFR